MEDTKSGLHIPANIRPRFEFFDGFGAVELTNTVIAALVSGFFAFIIYALFENLVMAVLCVLVSITASVMLQIKDASNQSINDQIKYVLLFIRTQKVYPYFYFSENVTGRARRKKS